MVRALVSGARGWGFESSRPCQFTPLLQLHRLAQHPRFAPQRRQTVTQGLLMSCTDVPDPRRGELSPQ